MDYDKILGTYSLEEILNLNDVTEAETLEHLVNQGYVKLPSILPVDCYD